MAESAEVLGPAQRAPDSVRNAVGLLRLQATIWALLSAAIAAGGSIQLEHAPSKVLPTAVVITVALVVITALFAAAKFRLAYKLPRGNNSTREAVIIVEGLMASFAVFAVLALTVTMFGLIISPPFIVGGIMSAVVAHGLTKPPARSYFDAVASRRGA